MKNKPTIISNSTKATKNRITALILALLLTATVLIPQIPVKAEGTTTQSADISENNSTGGGHDVPTRGKLVATQTKIIDNDLFSTEHKYLNSTDDYTLIELMQSAPENSNLGRRMLCVVFKNPSSLGFSLGTETIYHQNDNTLTSATEYKFSELSAVRHVNGSDVYYLFGLVNYSHGYQESSGSTTYYTASIVSDYHCYIDTKYSSFTSALYSYVWDLFINNKLTVTPPTDEEIDTNPDSYVRDKNLGYLQGVRYYEVKNTADERDAVISWNASDSELNDCQIEIRANNYYTEWWNKKTSEIWSYKKYGDGISYKDGKYTFKTLESCRSWLSEKDINVSIKTQSYGTTEYYVRLLRLDKENNVVKCGGWVKIDINRGTSTKLPDSTSDTGDWDDDTGDWKDDDDSDDSYHDHVGDDGEIYYPPEVDLVV